MNWMVYEIEELSRLVSEWDALNQQAGAVPFLDSRFVLPLCRVFGDASLRLVRCTDDSGLIAMGILGRRGVGQWETFQPSQLPLGAWLMRPGQEYEPLLASLAASLPGMTLAIGVTQQDPSSASRPTDSERVRTLDYVQTARVTVSGSFDDYWSRRGKNLRHNMRRQRAKLDQDGIATKLEMLTRPDDVAEVISQYGALESAGWKSEYGTAVHPDNPQGRFYRTMLEDFCRAGLGRIYRYRFGDRVVALDLCIEGGEALVILKTTYDETVKAISPAFLMREESFRDLFSEGRIRRIEFYGKLMEWHLRWSEDARMLYHVNWYRSAMVPQLRSLASRMMYSASE